MVHTFQFTAMGSPCEVQADCDDPELAKDLGALAEAEARRIEARFSRYRADSLVGLINEAAGVATRLDAETAQLIAYADACWRMSGGLFDITSGALRRAWIFDGSDRVPDAESVAAALAHVGWNKVGWDGTSLTLAVGMEIDLGGIAKEYAVDMALARLARHAPGVPVLVNFGGDLRVSGPRAAGERWRVRIEGIDPDQKPAWLELAAGAITTSGDARRYVERGGRRYGHILDPRTGMPIMEAPRSVTVAAPTCVEAGILSTLAMLQGAGAEAFLKSEGVKAWVTR